jgi:tRNA A37 threonylcarbamoyladenosine dehydratase
VPHRRAKRSEADRSRSEGIGGHFVLVDSDALSLSNMSHLRAGVHHIGVNKTVLTARQLYEIDPYAQVTLFPEGLCDDNIAAFLFRGRRLDLLIEECDDMYMKLRLRELAASQSVPNSFLLSNVDAGRKGTYGQSVRISSE